MTHNEISGTILNVGIAIHMKLGPGLLESVYQKILAYELRKRGLKVEEEKPVPVVWNGQVMEIGFRADLVVEDKVIVELKSVEKMSPVLAKVLLTYLRVADRRLGLLMNFGEELLKDGIARVINGQVD